MNKTRFDSSNLELSDRVVAIKRVSKTVKGGRTMRFSALVVVGDMNGHVGVGLGKAGEVSEAIRKGKEAAQRNIVEVAIDENRSIFYRHAVNRDTSLLGKFFDLTSGICVPCRYELV